MRKNKNYISQIVMDGKQYFLRDTEALNKIPTKTSQLINNSGFITAADLPENATASNTKPKMAGTATVGIENAFARGDHVHPSDTKKVDKAEGMGLSSNDYTTAEKEKLAGVEAGANNYTLPAATAFKTGGVVLSTDISKDSANDTKAATPKAVASYIGASKSSHWYYGVCSTAATRTAKLVDIADFVLEKGAIVAVQFTYANSAASPTLNVNNTGALSMISCFTNAAIRSGLITANMTALFVCNGSQWVLINPYSQSSKT